MAVGFIQLVFNGPEKYIFNNNPNITFFKMFYRRHTDFYINNYTINGNINNNKIVNFNIPHGGDLLSKTYLNISNQKKNIELFYDYQNLYNTQNTNILDFYDSYSVKTSEFLKQNINTIRKFKLNLRKEETEPIYFSIFYNNKLSQSYTNSLKNGYNIYLEEDSNKYYYNINEFYNFYSFIYKNQNCDNLQNIPYVNEILSTINFNHILYFKIDIDFLNVSLTLQITQDIRQFAQDLFNYFINSVSCNSNNFYKCMVGRYQFLYISLKYDIEIIPRVKNFIYNYTKLLKLKIIQDKNEPINTTIKKNDDLKKTIKELFNISKNYIYYYEIIFFNEQTDINLTFLKNSSFLGDISGEDFNNFLIKKETDIVSSNNLYNNTNPTNFFIKALITIFCSENNISLQNFIQNINSPDFNYKNILSYYTQNKNIINFNQQIIDMIMVDKPFYMNDVVLSKILFTKNIKEQYFLSENHIKYPLTNQKINKITPILNYYFYKNCINFFNSGNISTDERYNILKSSFLLFNNTYSELENNYFDYYENNFIYSSNSELFNFFKTKNILENVSQVMSYNIFQYTICNSLNISINILSKKSKDIYQNNGYPTSIFKNNDIYTSIFPLSSMLFINVNKDIPTKFTGFYFTNDLSNYLKNIIRINNFLFNKLFTKYKTNPQDKLLYTFPNSTIYNTLKSYCETYYESYQNYYKNVKYELIEYFYNKNKNKNNNFKTISNNIYDYTNKNLFNNFFNNILEEEHINKFIFLQSSPLYRIYYLLISFNDFTNKYDVIQDAITLRNFILDFIITYIEYFNSGIIFKNENNFDFQNIFNDDFFILNNFCCYGDISSISNKNIINEIKDNDSKITIFSSYYLLKLINLLETDNSLQNKINIFKNNFDDIIIKLFLDSLNKNKQYFENYIHINSFLNTIFNKNKFNLEKYFLDLNLFINSESEILKFNKENLISNEFYYYTSYYTIFSIGSLFDNINYLTYITTNNIFNMFKNVIQELNNLDYCVIKTPSLIQYKNIYKTTNLTSLINKIKIPCENIFLSTSNMKLYSYHNNLISYIISIIKNNSIIVSTLLFKNVFEEIINLIKIQFNFFNQNNNTNINFSSNEEYIFFNKDFKNYNSAVIFLYILYFFNLCLKIDIDNFILNNKENNKIFNDYLVQKYTYNIYERFLQSIILLIESNLDTINLDYFTNLISFYNNNFNKNNNYKISSVSQNNNQTYNKTLFDNYYKNNNYIIQKYNYQQNNLFLKQNLLEISQNIFNNNNKIYYTLYQNVKNIVENNIQDSKIGNIEFYYKQFKNGFYSNSLNKIKEIYNLLNSNYKSIQLSNEYNNLIINECLNIIKNFYGNNNYYKTLFYKQVTLEYQTQDNNFQTNNDIYNYSSIQKLLIENTNNSSVSDLYLKLLTNNVNNSFYYEENINSIIYLLSTQYLFDEYNISKIDRETIIKTPLYNIVKIFEFIKIKDNENYSSTQKIKKYLENTSLYSNQESFNLINIDNLLDNKPLIQNIKILEILEIMDNDIDNNSDKYIINGTLESYRKKLIDFNKYCVSNKLDYVINMELSNGTSIYQLFLINTEIMYENIYNYLLLNEYFSPRQIFNDIINFKQNKSYDLKLEINYDQIKIKIFVYLFFTYITLTYLPHLLQKEFINNINNDKNIEFYFNDIYYDIPLTEVFEKYKEIIIFSINYVYSINKEDIDNLHKNMLNFNFLNDKTRNNIETLLKITKKRININEYFNTLCLLFITSYHQIVEQESNDSLFCEKTIYNYDLKSLVNNINFIIEKEKKTKFNISFYLYNKFNFSINNIIKYSKIVDNYFISSNINKYKQYLNKVNISDFNITFVLLTLILQYFTIYYENEINDIDSALFSLKNGNTNIILFSDVQKGLYTYKNSSDNIYNNSIQNYNTKINLIVEKSVLSRNFKNMNIINPSTFDRSVNFMNYNFTYQNRLNKYYNEQYNYYNYIDNYNSIYKNVYEYYVNLLKNPDLIFNLKQNTEIYNNIFYEIFTSFIAKTYDINKNSIFYIPLFNELLGIYTSYNLKIKNLILNKNINNSNIFERNIYYNTYTLLYEKMKELYYYQLFNIVIDKKSIEKEFYIDVDIFFDRINNYYNQNMKYSQIYYNITYKIFISQIFTVKFINYKLNKNYSLDYEMLLNFNKLLNNKISSSISFFTFFNQYYNNNFINQKESKENYELNYALANLLNKKKFSKKIENYLKEYIYYIGIDNQDIHLENIYNSNFKNELFEFVVYKDSTFIIRNIVFPKEYIESIVYTYLNYFFNSQENIFYIYKSIILFLRNSFNSHVNKKYYEYIYQVIIKKEDFDYSEEIINDLQKLFLNKENLDINPEEIYICIKLLNFVLNFYWNFFILNKNKTTKNTIYKQSLLIFNFYYYTLNIINQKNNINKELEYVFENKLEENSLFENFSSLNILFNLMQKMIPFIYFSNGSYKKNIITYINDVNYYVNKFGNKFLSVNTSKLISAKLDFLNSNYIKNNKISNYYKNVSLNTIYDIHKYDLLNKKYITFFNNDNFIQTIYYELYKKYNIDTENYLGTNIFYNTIVNLFNNYNSITDIYYFNETYILNIYKVIYENILLKLEYLNDLIGGKDKNTYNSGKYGILFDKNNLKNEDNFATVFTTCMNNLNFELNNNSIVLYLYYLCYFVWLMTKNNNENNIVILENNIYNFANFINVQLLKYIESKYTTNEELFVSLNKILFNNYTNKEYITECNNLFNSFINSLEKSKIINNDGKNKYSFVYFNDSYKKILNESNFQSFDLMDDIEYKINKWKYFLGVIVDYNKSDIIKILKSINKYYLYAINIQEKYIKHIINILGGLINRYGIINIIDDVILNFDSEQIDSYSGYQYKIFYDLLSNTQQKDALGKMFGIEDDYITNSKIRPYIKIFNKRDFSIPVNFYNKQFSNAIPLISMLYSKIIMKFQLSNIRNIFRNNLLTNEINKNGNIYNLNCDFVFIEKNERIEKTKKKIDNIINTHSYYNTKITKKLEDLFYEEDGEISISFDFELYNLCERLIWNFKILFDDNEIINNFEINSLNEVNNIYQYRDGSYKNFIKQVKLYIDDGLISSVNNLSKQNYSEVTSLMNLYKYTKYTDISKNYNCNSFSLEPDIYQPTGCLNMSMFKYFKIKILLKRNFLDFVNKMKTLYGVKNITFGIELSLNEYNLIRYQSGLSGLLFIK